MYGNQDDTYGGYNQGDIGNLQKFNQERLEQRSRQHFSLVEAGATGLVWGAIFHFLFGRNQRR